MPVGVHSDRQCGSLPKRSLHAFAATATTVLSGQTWTAQQEEKCAVTGQVIQTQQVMWLGLTLAGELVPISTKTAV